MMSCKSSDEQRMCDRQVFDEGGGEADGGDRVPAADRCRLPGVMHTHALWQFIADTPDSPGTSGAKKPGKRCMPSVVRTTLTSLRPPGMAADAVVATLCSKTASRAVTWWIWRTMT